MPESPPGLKISLSVGEGGGGGVGGTRAPFVFAPGKCIFFYPSIGVGVRRVPTSSIGQNISTSKKKRGGGDGLARILPECRQTFARIRYIGNICLGGRHSAPVTPPPRLIRLK